MTVDTYYPVLIPTLCRFEHFKRCVETLSACTHADKTTLYIALDYPLKEDHWEGYKNISSFIDNIKGFENVIVLKREKNLGPAQNIKRAKDVIFDKYDAYIFSEDDNEFSPNFLDYMNKCLNRYKDNPSIYAVCGYNFPVDFGGYNKNIYFNHLYSAWGVGRWRYKEIPFEISSVKSILGSLRHVIRIYYYNPKYLLYLLRMVQKKVVYGDLLVCAYSIAQKKLNIFPTVSKVRNHGHDGSGQNSTVIGKNKYETQVIDQELFFDVDDIEVKRLKCQKMDKYLDISLGQKVKMIPKLLLYWIKQ